MPGRDLSAKGNTEVNIADQIPDPQVARPLRRDSVNHFAGPSEAHEPKAREKLGKARQRRRGRQATLLELKGLGRPA